MIATGLINEKFLQCKNSYRNDPTKIDGDDIEVVHISLDPSDTGSEWTLFNEDDNEDEENDDREPFIDAYFISIELSA